MPKKEKKQKFDNKHFYQKRETTCPVCQSDVIAIYTGDKAPNGRELFYFKPVERSKK